VIYTKILALNEVTAAVIVLMTVSLIVIAVIDRVLRSCARKF